MKKIQRRERNTAFLISLQCWVVWFYILVFNNEPNFLKWLSSVFCVKI